MRTTTKIKNYLKIGLYLFLTTFFFNCQNEDFSIEEKHELEHKNYNISFLEFKNETNIKNFKPILKTKISNKKYLNKNNTLDESNFLTDTTNIKRFENPENNKITYSFKIYPLNNTINDKEYYNLVYEKDGDNWSEMIFFNTDEIKEGTDNLTLKTSEMVYNSRGPSGNWSEVVTTNFHCTGCVGACDFCSLCVSTSVSYIYVGGGSSGSIDGTIDAGSSSGGGGSNSSSIYIPNPYTAGEQDINNPLYILASEVSTYTNSLPQNLQTIIAGESWFFPTIFNYFNNNGVINTTKANVTNALNDYNNLVADFNIGNVRARERFKYWAFNTLLYNNRNNVNSQAILDIKNYLLTTTNSSIKSDITDYLYENLNSQEAFDNITETVGFINTNINLQNAESFAQEAIETFSNNDEVNFEDQIIIELEFLNNECLSDVFSDMNDNSTSFKGYLENFMGETPVSHLRFKYDDNFSNNFDPEYHNSLAITKPPQNFVIDIIFNGDANFNFFHT